MALYHCPLLPKRLLMIKVFNIVNTRYGGDARLRITKNDDAKALIFWLTSDEADMPNIKSIISQKTAQYSIDSKYKIVTFISGNADYTENTKSLLLHNTEN